MEPELTQSTRNKISLFAGLKRSQSLKQKVSTDEGRSFDQNNEADCETSDQASDLSRSSTALTQSTNTSNTTSRYTISAAARPCEPNTADSNDVQKVPMYRPATATDLVNHGGQIAELNVPQVDSGLELRLAGLKQFRALSQQIHEESNKHKEILEKARGNATQSNASNGRTIKAEAMSGSGATEHSGPMHHDLPLRDDNADTTETSVVAPTPFSSPLVTPVPVSAIDVERSVGQHTYSMSSPMLDLQAKPGRPRAGLRTIVVSSTPVKELEKQSRSRSGSQSLAYSRSRSRPKEKKYPPISFPRNFNDRFTEPVASQQMSEPPQAQRTDYSQPSTRSVSPMTKPTDQDEEHVPYGQEPLPTPHDERGRPVFYSTIFYFVECPHTSPPATRPLDPNAQPRIDPDFHPTKDITRSIIPGSCFSCDTLHRREKEEDIITSSVRHIGPLTQRLARLVEQLELDIPSSEDEDDHDDKHAARLHTYCNFAEDTNDLRHQLSSLSLPPLSDDPSVPNTPRELRLKKAAEHRSYTAQITREIRSTEADIDRIREDQDARVRDVWKGYTSRWGPATLGVQSRGENRSVSRGRSGTASTGDDCQTPSMARTNSSIISASTASHRDVPGSREPGEGKMKVAWHRE